MLKINVNLHYLEKIIRPTIQEKNKYDPHYIFITLYTIFNNQAILFSHILITKYFIKNIFYFIYIKKYKYIKQISFVTR